MTPPTPDPVFTPAQVREDGQNRVARTTGQVSIAGALVLVGQWVAQQAGWDGEIPLDVATALTVVLSAAGSWLTNKSRLRAT